MKLDNLEFISRHYKSAGAAAPAMRSKTKIGLNHLIVGLLYGSVLALMCLVSYHYLEAREYSPVVILIAGTIIFFYILIGLFIYRSYFIHSQQYEELNLLREVMQGSRGARLITGAADETVYTNLKFEELCKGLGPPGFKTLLRLFEENEEARSHFRLLSDQAHRGLTDSIELFSKVEDRERWFVVTAQPISGWAGHIHWRVDDVTQKHTVDRAIREEREKLIDFTDNAPVGFFSVDHDGRFVFANATFARWLGEDLQRLLFQSRLHTYLVDPPKNANPYDLADGAGPRQVVELKMKGPAGKSFLASINQVVVNEADGRVRTRAVVHDLTAEKEMRQALKASEDRFQRFFEEAPLGIVLIDENGMIQDCNNAFANMIDVEVSNIEGKDFSDLVDDESRDMAVGAIKKIEQGGLSEPLEIFIKSPSEAETAYAVQLHARRFREGGNIVLHFLDLRKQKALEEQFAQSQKMQAVGQLAGGVAHDFNNLLTAMIGFCDLLLLRHKPGDPSFGDIMQIKQNSNRAANLVRQLLAFSRQQTLRPKVQDVTDILTELSHLLRRLIGANIELELFHGQELGLIKVDEVQMEQVLINMAVNARDAMNEKGNDGGTLSITTKNYTNRKPKRLLTETLTPGHWVVIEISDTGCGIKKENMTRIFEPFFTTKAVGQGTGLGLATVYGIIRQTGGFLDVNSKIDKGTTFSIYLPKATEVDVDDDDAIEEVPEVAKDLTGTERILLVEDEDAVRTFSERALVNKGYEVISAIDGEAALNLMEEQENKHFDLMITDVMMPNMDGPTLAKHMREAAPKLKIIFVSGYTEDKLKDYMGEGIYFLPKPFTLKQLAEKVKDVLDD